MDREEHTARIVQLEGEQHESAGKMAFSERRNSVADLQYSMLSDKCNSLKTQFASGGVCKEGMLQLLANPFKNVDASLDDFNRHAAHAQKGVPDTFCK